MTTVHLSRVLFGERERIFLEADGVAVSLFRYDSGVEAVRLATPRGFVIVLPYLGQMVWDAQFDEVRLTMGNMFHMPRPVTQIIDTYGCFAFHSGLLRNGCPGPEDSHALHGEMPCATMDSAALELGADDQGAFVRLAGAFEYVQGFGAHYVARPSVTVRSESTVFDIAMSVRNLGGMAMDLMYMCHVNFAFAEGGRFIQPAPFTPDHLAVRTVLPAHVPSSAAYLSLIEDLARDPARMEVLDEPQRYDPEQVFYLRDLRADASGETHVMLRRHAGDAFVISYDPVALPKTVRWVLVNRDQQVAALALPSTCEPEGYTAEKAKGNLRALQPGETASFRVRTGYADRAEADRAETLIRSL